MSFSFIFINIKENILRTLLLFASLFFVILSCSKSNITAQKPVSVSEISNPKDSTITADYIVVCNDSLYNSALSFCQYRKLHKTTGIDSVAIVKWSAIRNSFDSTNCKAMKSFLAYALKSWHKAPRYVLLLGDNTVDVNGVPVADSTLTDISDNYYADANSDGVIDFCIGRIPAQTNAEAIGVLNKIENYEKNIPTRIGFAVDDSCEGTLHDILNFASSYHNILNSLDSTNTPTDSFLLSVYNHGDCDLWNDSLKSITKTNFLKFLNKGNGVISLFGRNGIDVFTDEGVLSSSDTGKLTSNNVYLGLCHFTDFLPTKTTGKALLFKKVTGAVALIGTFGCGGMEDAMVYQQSFFSALSHKRFKTIGEIHTASLNLSGLNLGGFSWGDNWILLGDPTMRIVY